MQRIPDTADMPLGFPGYTFADLHRTDRLGDLFETFRDWLGRSAPAMAERYERYLADRGTAWLPTEVSALLVDAGRALDDFLAILFQQQHASEHLRADVERDRPILWFKREFVQRRVLKKMVWDDAAAHDPAAIAHAATAAAEATAADVDAGDPELRMAVAAQRLVERERQTDVDDATADRHLAAIEQWCMAVTRLPELHVHVKSWVSFHLPATLDYQHLVHVVRANDALPGEMTGPDEHLRRRDGFHLTDPRYTRRAVTAESDYCIFCHDRDRDSCSKGLREKDGTSKRNPLGIELDGCPLDEKISEMQMLRSEGRSLGALAVVMIDNPMCPGTGHRICNDCMKSCIYQKQEPVNIPQIETGALTDVLALPYGPEIYFLLTRWNPLNVVRPVALPYNGRNVLVVGMGPAGYTLAHYLLNEGFGVVGIDGLKIEPLDDTLVGTGTPPAPLRDFHSIVEDLAERPMRGFGGVSEYGITVRWDKNFLTLIQIALERRNRFRLYGGVRFGGTLTIDDAWQAGFDHVALATGAGRPTIVDMKNNMCRGMRMASDFLMGLQLTGAARATSLANLQVQLPALVVGGGLTAVDTATELMAYYPVQVAKVAARYHALVANSSEEAVRAMYSPDEREVLDRFLGHADALDAERRRAAQAGERPNFIPLLRSWGGVRIVYRKQMTDSPAYRLNHEEIIKALEEGISFVECLSPLEALVDGSEALDAVVFERQAVDDGGKWRATGECVTLPARSLMIAAGTSPNTIIARENPGTFALDPRTRYFIPHLVDEHELVEVPPTRLGFFTSYTHEGRHISYFGDNHPRFAGNVVKAMASAKLGYRAIADLLLGGPSATGDARRPHPDAVGDAAWTRLLDHLDDRLLAEVVAITRYTPTIVEVTVRARGAAERFEPGQFYRVQNYERNAPVADGTPLTMEGLALTGAWVDREEGLLSMIVLEMGSSSRLCAALRIGERIVVMGPTGAPTEIPQGENVLLAGGGLGNAVLFSIARALVSNGCRVIYFAGYKKGEDLYRRKDIEDATTQVIWSTDDGAEIEPHRPQDAHFRGNIVQAMLAYASGTFGEPLVPLSGISRVIAIGSDRMMAAVAAARHGVLAPHLGTHVGIGSINSPMQCMMKEICAQCLQRHVDPTTGREQFVFSCYFQDQELDHVDWKNLNDRLRQNTVLEKLSNRYLDRLLTVAPGPLS